MTNQLAIDADARYARLDGPTRHTWDEYFNPYTMEWVCYRVDENGDPVFDPDHGRSMYRAVNLNRADQGLAWTDTAPSETWDGQLATMDMDLFSTTAYEASNIFTGIAITLHADIGSDPLPFFCSVYTRCCQNESNITRTDRRMKYVNTFTLESETTTDLTQYLAATSLFYYGCSIRCMVQIGWPGALVKFAETFAIRNLP